MTTAADNGAALCTTSVKCATTTSCCATWTDSASGTASTSTICIPKGSKKGTGIAAAADLTASGGAKAVTKGSNYFPVADCTGASGASSLAVSAAAAATALYVLY